MWRWNLHVYSSLLLCASLLLCGITFGNGSSVPKQRTVSMRQMDATGAIRNDLDFSESHRKFVPKRGGRISKTLKKEEKDQKKKKSNIFARKEIDGDDRWCDTKQEKKCRNKCFDDKKCKNNDSCKRGCREKCCDRRLCDKKDEKKCRGSCFRDKKCGDNDEDCKKRCRDTCCKAKKRKKKRNKVERTCNTDEERDCFRPCKQTHQCDDTDKKCLQRCKKECNCVRESDTADKGDGDGDDDGKNGDETSTADKDKDDDASSDSRLCNTLNERECREECFEKNECAEDDEDCKKPCRAKCCSSDSRLCNTLNERECREECFEKNECAEDDEDCKKPCRAKCCDDDGNDDDRHNKGGGNDNGNGNPNAPTTDKTKKPSGDTTKGPTPVNSKEPSAVKTKEPSADNVNEPSSSPTIPSASTPTAPTTPLTSTPTAPTSSPTNFPTGPTNTLFTGDLPVDVRFNTQTSVRISAEDIKSGKGNTVKKDLERGLKLLVPEVLAQLYGNAGSSRSLKRKIGIRQEHLRDKMLHHLGTQQRIGQEHNHRRWLLVELSDDSQPEVKDVFDADCGIEKVNQGGCKRIDAEVVLKLTDENESQVKRAFRAAMRKAIDEEDRLEKKIKEFNPNFGTRPKQEVPVTQSTSDDGGLTKGQIVGIALSSFVGTILLSFALYAAVRRRRRKNESEAGSEVDPDAHYDRVGLPVDSVRRGEMPETQREVSSRVGGADVVDDGSYTDSRGDIPESFRRGFEYIEG